MKKPQFTLWNLIAGLYTCLFLWILFLAYTGNLPPQLQQIPFYDKIGHVVLYSAATYLGHRVFQYRQTQVFGFRSPLFPVLFGAFTIVEELFQGFSPNRSLDAIDLIASVLGISLGYWLAEKGRR